MTQPELFPNNINSEDFHITIETCIDTSIDLWLEKGEVHFIVADRYGDNIFAIAAPKDEVKVSINGETFAFVYGDIFRYRGEIAPSILGKTKKKRWLSVGQTILKTTNSTYLEK